MKFKQPKYVSSKREASVKESKNNKELLQKKFMKEISVTNNLKEDTKENESTIDYKKLYRNLKKELDKTLKENANLKSSIRKDNDEDRKLKSEINILKSNIQELLTINHNLERKLIEYNSLIDEKSEEIYILESEKFELDRKYNETHSKSQSLYNHIDNLRKKVHWFEKRSDDLYASKIKELEEVIDKHLRKFEKLQPKLKEYEAKIRNYENNSPREILQLLYDKMTTQNVFEYNLSGILFRKYKATKRSYFDQRNYHLTGKTKTTDSIIYGFIKFTNDNPVFNSLLNEEYTINHYVGNKLYDGTPCASFINENNTVDVFWYYETEVEMYKDIKTHSNYKKDKLDDESSNIDEEVYDLIGNFKVLIITSENGIRYRNRLQHHGLIATWIDPFEKSPVHVKTLMRSHDIVLMCVENMPHSVLDSIDGNSDKYQFVTNHSEEILVARTRYAAKQLRII